MHAELPPLLRGHIRLFQCLGTFNVSFQSNPLARSRTERLLSAWAALLLTVYTLVTANTFMCPEQFLFMRDRFGYFNDAFKVCIAQLTISVIYVETITQRESLRSFWLLYGLLRKCGAAGTMDDSSWLAQLSAHFRFLFIFYGILLMDAVMEALFLGRSNTNGNVIMFWYMFTPYMYLVHMRNMQFIFHIEIIRQKLVKLERDLELLAEYARFARRVVAFEGFEEFLRRQLMQEQLIYQRIYDMFNNFQKAFGLSLVVVLLMIYVRVLVDAYFVYYGIYRGAFHIEHVLILPALFEIPALLITSKNCMNMVKYITYQLHNIQSHLKDTLVSVQVQNFSLQILHEKIRIDGQGIRTLDGYMLSAVLGSVTTYMIFFIQFMPKFRHI